MKFYRRCCTLVGTFLGSLIAVSLVPPVLGQFSLRNLVSEHLHQYDYPASIESAERFFKESNVTMHYDLLEGVGNLFRITATTPLPIFCAIVWKYHDPIGEDDNVTTASIARHSVDDDVGVIEMQLMGDGATTDHNIFLWSLPALDDGDNSESPRRIDVRAYGFLSNGRVVFISPTYRAKATKDNPTLVEIGPGDVVSPELNTTMVLAPIIIEDKKYVKTPDSLGMQSASAFAVANTTEMLDNVTIHDALTVFRSDAPLDVPIAALPSNLKPETTYVVGGNLLYPTGKVQLTEVVEFTTPPKVIEEVDPCMTRATLTVTDVSSNWRATEVATTNDSVFGADKAVDGDTSTAWSSYLDGDDAYLEVELDVAGVPGPYDVASVGYWSRMMTDGTSIVNTFRVTNPLDGEVLVTPECPLPTFTEMHRCSVTDLEETGRPLVSRVRFEVVSSTGGNTGAMEVEVLVSTPNAPACLESMQTGGSMEDDIEDGSVENGPEEGSVEDGTNEGTVEDGANEGATEDETNDEAVDDGTNGGTIENGTVEGSAEDATAAEGEAVDPIKANAVQNDGSWACSLNVSLTPVLYSMAVMTVFLL